MKNISLKKGFTLIEMIVSIAIFTVVALVAVGAFLKIIDLNNKSHTLKDSINNLNFALDAMSRDLRVGSNYYCPTISATIFGNTLLPKTNCDSGQMVSWRIYFYSPKTMMKADNSGPCRLIHAYRYLPSPDKRTIDKAEQQNCEDNITDNSPDFTPIISFDPDATSKAIFFTSSTMKVVRPDIVANPLAVPYIQFHFAGYVGTKEKTKSYFDFQTSMSQRISD